MNKTLKIESIESKLKKQGFHGILIVDNNPENITAAKKYCEEKYNEINFYFASDKDSAEKIMQDNHPTLIITKTDLDNEKEGIELIANAFKYSLIGIQLDETKNNYKNSVDIVANGLVKSIEGEKSNPKCWDKIFLELADYFNIKDISPLTHYSYSELDRLRSEHPDTIEENLEGKLKRMRDKLIQNLEDPVTIEENLEGKINQGEYEIIQRLEELNEQRDKRREKIKKAIYTSTIILFSFAAGYLTNMLTKEIQNDRQQKPETAQTHTFSQTEVSERYKNLITDSIDFANKIKSADKEKQVYLNQVKELEQENITLQELLENKNKNEKEKIINNTISEMPINIPENINELFVIKKGTYSLNHDLKIGENGTLIIENGTELNFEKDKGIRVEGGTLKILGTEKDSVILDAEISNWYGISIQNSKNDNRIQYTKIINSKKNAGAGVYLENSKASINHSTIIRCNAIQGGGLFSNQSQIKAENTLITECMAEKEGGGVLSYESEDYFKKTTITKNSSGAGGGIFGYKSNIKIENISIISNYAYEVGGGIANCESLFYEYGTSKIQKNNPDNVVSLFSTIIKLLPSPNL